MKLLILLVSLVDSLLVVSWNVENFLDPKEDTTGRHTAKRLQAKCSGIAKTIFIIAEKEGRLPDAVALMEVGNKRVLRKLLSDTPLRKLDYDIIHYDSPDRRGIDVALLYRSSVLELIDAKPCHLFDADTVMATRDILLCVFRRKESAPFAVLVNHHPSKYGGASESEPKRRIAVDRLRFLADSLAAEGIDRILAGGDFNDTPDNPAFLRLEPALKPLHTALFRRGEGTIKYDGKWSLIDHFYASPAMLEENPSMRILRIPFLLTRDTAHSGEKPLRTYTGPRHAGGVSDHLPIIAIFSVSSQAKDDYEQKEEEGTSFGGRSGRDFRPVADSSADGGAERFVRAAGGFAR